MAARSFVTVIGEEPECPEVKERSDLLKSDRSLLHANTGFCIDELRLLKPKGCFEMIVVSSVDS